MKHPIAKFTLLFFCICLLLVLPLPSKAQEESSVVVTYNVGEGGLLWVNGSIVGNGTVVSYANNSVVSLVASLTNSSYSFAGFNYNGSTVLSNPANFTLINSATLNLGGDWNVSSDWVVLSNQSIGVLFDLVVVPSATPDPDALTADGAFAVAIVGVIAAVVAVGLVIYLHKPDET